MTLGETICLFFNNVFPKLAIGGRESAQSYSESQYSWAKSSLALYSAHITLKDKDVLDAGCGLGGKTVYYAEKGCNSIVGVDMDEDHIKYSMQFAEEKGLHNIQFRVADLSCLPFEANRFDLIFLNDVVEHIKRPLLIRALEECKRVVKINGRICLEFPPWTSWDAAHLYDFINIPWCQCFFSDDTLIRITKRQNVNSRFGRLSVSEHFKELNRIRMGEFKHIIRKLNFKVIHLDNRMIKDMNLLKHIPVLHEYLTTRVIAILSK